MLKSFLRLLNRLKRQISISSFVSQLIAGYQPNRRNSNSTYFNAKDKFGRKSKEGVYAIYRNANGKEVELSKKEVYNKEYSYVSNSPNRTSELVSEIKYTGAYNNTIHYGYDGNINAFPK